MANLYIAIISFVGNELRTITADELEAEKTERPQGHNDQDPQHEVQDPYACRQWNLHVQNKLLEALAMGLPCVTSTAAFRGTAIVAGEGIFASDEPGEFARRVIDLLQASTLRAEMARRARAAAEANYRWDAQLSGLDRIIAEVSQPLPRMTSVY